MEPIVGVLIIAGIIAVGFYVVKKNRSDVTRTPKSGGGGIKPVDGKGGVKE